MKVSGRYTHFYTARQMIFWKHQLIVELVRSFAQPSLATEYYLILEQRHEPIAIVSPRFFRLSRSQIGIVLPVALAGAIRCLVNLSIAMQAHDNVRNAKRLDNFEHHAPGNHVAGSILAVWVVRLDVEIGYMASLGAKGCFDTREDGPLLCRGSCSSNGMRGHRRRSGRVHDAANRKFRAIW